MLARIFRRRAHRLALPALFLIGAAALLVAGCGEAPAANDEAVKTPALTEDGPASTPAADGSRPTIVFLGDSLTSGFGLDEEQAFPALVADALAEAGSPVRIVNAGVNGDTTAGGLARLDWLLRQEPAVLVIGLGGNDGLRGLDPDMSEANLAQIIERADSAGVIVVLLGMQLPPNYGRDYLERFAAIYPRLAETYGVIRVPFLLEGVGGEPALNLPDGIHPNAEGHEIVARTVTPYVQQAIEGVGVDP